MNVHTKENQGDVIVRAEEQQGGVNVRIKD